MKGLRAALISQGVASGGQFLVTLVLVRTLGLSDFGVLAAVLILAGYGAGLVQAVCAQPFLSLPPGKGLGRASLALGLVIGGAAGLIASALAHAFGSSAYGLSAPLAGGLVAARSLVPMARAFAHSDGRVRSLVAVDSIGAFGALGLLLVQGAEVGIAGAAAALATASGAACALGLLSCPLPRPDGPLAEPVKRLWRSGRWLALNQVFSWMGTGGVHGAVLLHLGPTAVGALRLAQTVVGLPLAALQALDLALPKAARAALNRGQLGGWVRRVSLGALGFFGLFGAALTLTAGWLVDGILRPQAGGPLAVEALAWLAFLPAIAALTGVQHVGFRAREDTRSIFVSYAASSVVVGLCAGFLVPSFGIAGAAAGLLGGQALFAAGLCVLWRGREKRLVGDQDGLRQKLV